MDHNLATTYTIMQQDLTPSPTQDDRAQTMQKNFRLCYGFVGVDLSAVEKQKERE